MEEYKIINYSNIFLTYLHKTDRVCTFTVKDHTLFYLHSGEMEIEENGRFTRFHEGELLANGQTIRFSVPIYPLKTGKYSLTYCVVDCPNNATVAKANQEMAEIPPRKKKIKRKRSMSL